jgi:hypothetical protein
VTGRATILLLVAGCLLGADLPTSWFVPWLEAEQLEAFLAREDLDGTTGDAVRARYALLESGYAAHAVEVAALFERAADRRHPNGKRRETRLDLERRFEADVTELLPDTAAAAWTRLLLDVRRQRVLPEVEQYAGRRPIPDLVALVDERAPADTRDPQLTAAVDAYAHELDVLLVDWEMKIDGVLHALAAAYGNPVRTDERPPAGATSRPADSRPKGTRNHEQAKRLNDRIGTMVRRVRAVNDRHADALDGAIAEAGRPFATELLRRRYPNVFIADPAELALGALRRAELTEIQAAAIEKVRLDHLERIDANRRRIIDALEAWDDPDRRERREQRRRELIEEGGDPGAFRREHPVLVLLEERRMLTADTCRRVRDVLDADDLSRLGLDLRVLLASAAAPAPESAPDPPSRPAAR